MYDHVNAIRESYEDDKFARAQEMAELLLKRHDLVRFVQEWNNGDPDGSLILNVSHLKEALDIHFSHIGPPLNVYRPSLEVDFEFSCLVEVCMDCVLLPIINDTFSVGLQRIVTRWARATLRCAELRSTSPAPFASEAEYQRWLVHFQFHARPRGDEETSPELILCSPEGNSFLLPQAVEEALAAYALLENIDLAGEQGWLKEVAIHPCS